MIIDDVELALKLDGIEYPVDIDKDLIARAKESGLVIAYPQSDDLLEFEGAWYDEAGHGPVYVDKDGILESDCPAREECPHFQKLQDMSCYFTVEFEDDVGFYVRFHNSNGNQWHTPTFAIMETHGDGTDQYGTGTIVDLRIFDYKA